MSEFNDLCTDLCELREINAHTDAYILACTFLNAHLLIEELEAIAKRSNELGFLPHNMVQKRYDLYQEMLVIGKKQLTLEEYKKFYNCF